jgi:hypothetical protein
MKKRCGLTSISFSVTLSALIAAVGLSTTCLAQLCPTNQVCVTTWQQDTGTDVGAGFAYRTGENLQEGTITPTTIRQPNFNFGQLCSVQLDGQVYETERVLGMSSFAFGMILIAAGIVAYKPEAIA